MEMVEETESPRLYHLWCAISVVGAALGRRCYLPFMDDKILPNMFILLVGNAATRKSTAMNIGKRLLKECTDVQFAPDSTGGKHQGLVSAMLGEEGKEEDELEKALSEAGVDEMLSDTGLGNLPFGDARKKKLRIAPEDKHVLYATASEFNTFIGHNNIEFLEFLGKTYDGEEYKYQLRKEWITLENTLINLIGCTTPTNIATAMPPSAIGQGFTSRIILVYGDKKYKTLDRPPPFSPELRARLQNALRTIYFEFGGPFKETDGAYQYQKSVYYRPSEIVDSRFTYYSARRHTHFTKLGMILAAMRGSLLITEEDYTLADKILLQTEQLMPEALGEYGLSPVSMAKQRIVEFLRAVDEPVTSNVLWSMLGRDIKLNEFHSCLQDLIASEKIERVDIQVRGTRQTAYIPISPLAPETLELMDALQTSPGTGTVQ